MADNWYPVIDYVTCIECGACISKCTHNVYDPTKSPSPVVVNTQFCVDHCHGCGNLCPVGAISYVGDNTGWLPLNGEKSDIAACCCGSEPKGKKIVIEYLYLDLKVCDRCVGTDTVLEEVLAIIAPALEIAGFDVELHKIEIETAQLAEQHRFLSSPTIRVNNHDVCKSVEENSCGCCSEISGSAIDCRVFEYENKSYEVPPKEMIAQAILQIVFGSPVEACTCTQYVMPENLKSFFEGKNKKQKCCCEENC